MLVDFDETNGAVGSDPLYPSTQDVAEQPSPNNYTIRIKLTLFNPEVDNTELEAELGYLDGILTGVTMVSDTASLPLKLNEEDYVGSLDADYYPAGFVNFVQRVGLIGTGVQFQQTNQPAPPTFQAGLGQIGGGPFQRPRAVMQMHGPSGMY